MNILKTLNILKLLNILDIMKTITILSIVNILTQNPKAASLHLIETIQTFFFHLWTRVFQIRCQTLLIMVCPVLLKIVLPTDSVGRGFRGVPMGTHGI